MQSNVGEHQESEDRENPPGAQELVLGVQGTREER